MQTNYELTDYDLALMSLGAYKLAECSNFKPPKPWYVSSFHPIPRSWDSMVVFYERSIKFKFEQGKIFHEVERVVAYRGTKSSSLWNWLTDFALTFGQKPLATFIEEYLLRSEPFTRGDYRQALLGLSQKLVADVKSACIQVTDTDIKSYLEKINKSEFWEKWKQLNPTGGGGSLEKLISKTTYTGHSLGATIAIMRAAYASVRNPELKTQAVVFDSPGVSWESLKMGGKKIDEQAIKWCITPNNVINYLSAPNLVNTCHPHPGQIRRLYIPHVNGWKLIIANGIASLSNEAARCLIAPFMAYAFTRSLLEDRKIEEMISDILSEYGFSYDKISYLVYPIPVAKALWNHLLPGFVHGMCQTITDNVNPFRYWQVENVFIKLIVGCGFHYFSMLSLSILPAAVFNSLWISNQHSIENITECLNPNRQPRPKDPRLVRQWPSFWAHHAHSRLARFMLSATPFPIINRGLLDLNPSEAEDTLERMSDNVEYESPCFIK